MATAITAAVAVPPPDKALSTFVLVKFDATLRGLFDASTSLNVKRDDNGTTLMLWDAKTDARWRLRPCGNRLVGKPLVRAATQTTVGAVSAHVTPVAIHTGGAKPLP